MIPCPTECPLPKERVISKRYHGLDDPEDGAVMSQQILPQWNVLLRLPPPQEALRVFVEPGLVPARDVVHLADRRGGTV